MIITFEHNGTSTVKTIEEQHLEPSGILADEEVLHHQLIDLYYFILSTEARRQQIILKKCTFHLTTSNNHKELMFAVDVIGPMEASAVLLQRAKQVMEEPYPAEVSEDLIFHRFEGTITTKENGISRTIAMTVLNAKHLDLDTDNPETNSKTLTSESSLDRVVFIENLDEDQSVLKIRITAQQKNENKDVI